MIQQQDLVDAQIKEGSGYASTKAKMEVAAALRGGNSREILAKKIA